MKVAIAAFLKLELIPLLDHVANDLFQKMRMPAKVKHMIKRAAFHAWETASLVPIVDGPGQGLVPLSDLSMTHRDVRFL